MRLKTYHAPTMQDAIDLVREQLGEEAIIVATQEDEEGSGVRVTAAMEPAEPAFVDQSDSPGPKEELLDYLTNILDRHGTPPPLTDRMIDEISQSEETTPLACLRYGLEAVFDFAPIDNKALQPALLLIGPPGVGKTVNCAKLATRCRLDEKTTRLVGMDHLRMAGPDQLKGYAEQIGVAFDTARNATELATFFAQNKNDSLVFIDTPGTNPYLLEEIAFLVEIADRKGIEPVLVLNAGRNWEETSDLSIAFKPVGPKRLIITGYDIARRLGSMLAAADAGNMALANISPGPPIKDLLEALSAEKLAHYMLSLSLNKNTDDPKLNLRPGGIN